MTEFLAGQTDYALFMGGVGFAIVATHAISLYRLGNRELPWRWLAGFSVLWVAVSWSQTLGLAYERPATLVYVESAVSAIAYLLLVQFWRLGFKTQVGWTQGRWILVPPAVLITLGLLGGQVALSAVVGYLLGIVSTLAGAVALAALARNTSGTARPHLQWCAAGLFLYGALGIWTTAQADVFPMSVFNEASFFQVTGVPVQLLRTVAVLLFAWQLGAYMQRVSPLWADANARSGLRHLGGLIAITMVAALVGGAFVTYLFGEQRLASELERLQVQVRITAAALDPQELEGLTGQAGDTATRSYMVVQQRLTAAREAAPDATFLYVLGLRDGRVVILAEGTPASADGAEDAPGTVYEEASPELLAALESPHQFVEGPLGDKWGTWYTAFTPVYSTNGGFVGLLGVDKAADTVDHEVAVARMNGILISLAASILILTFWSAIQLTRTWAARVASTERRFRQMFDNAPEGIFIMSLGERTIRVANPYMVGWLGYSIQELRSMPIEDIVVKGLESIAECLTEASAAEATTIKHECQYQRKDGGIVDVEVTAVPTSYEDERAVLVYARDMTGWHRSQSMLDYRARFNDLIVEISTGFINIESEHIDERIDEALKLIGVFMGGDRAYVMTLSHGGDLMSNTHEWVALGALSRRAVLQDVPVDTYPHIMETIADDADLIISDVLHTRELDEPERQALLDEDILSICAVPLMWRGELVGSLGFDAVGRRADWDAESTGLLRIAASAIVNAIERKRTSIEVRRLSQALDQSPVAVIVTDPGGAIEYVNRRFSELTGFSLAEAKGQNPRILKSEFTPKAVYEELWETVMAGNPWTGEFINKTKGGLTFYASASISAIFDYTGEITNFIGVEEDITAIKQAEEALVSAKHAAEDANRAKSEFLAAMSHEIRTPMNAIIGMGELLDETDLSPQQSRYVSIFKSAGEALLALINDVLDLSKIEAGRFEMDRLPFDLEELVERTAAVLGVKAREKGLELLFRIEPGTPQHVVGDPDRLRQVLINLLGNAVKFTESGQVLISVSCARRGMTASGESQGEYRFSVEDTGIGVPTHKLEAIFESFTQADSSTTRKYGGTGLGLTISRRLVELMGGHLRVASEVGVGTTFSFDLPLGISDGEYITESRPNPELADLRVLVVDDNATNRLIVSEMLAGTGAVIEEAAEAVSGLAAVRAAAKRGAPFDVIVLDNHMPGMSGVEFAGAVRSDESLSHSGIIMLSSDQTSETASVLKELGVSDYLTKPIRRVDLQSAIAIASPRARVNIAEEVVEAAPAGDVSGGRPLNILIAEDSEDNRFLLQAHLSKTEHRVSMAKDGAEAVDLFESRPGEFDLVLMDMQMPVMDGYEATRRLRAFEETTGIPPVPVIALTAYALKEEIQKSLDAGCDGHLTKPIKRKTFLEAIRRYGEEAADE